MPNHLQCNKFSDIYLCILLCIIMSLSLFSEVQIATLTCHTYPSLHCDLILWTNNCNWTRRLNLEVLECLPVHESSGAVQRIRQDSFDVLIGPARHSHRRPPGLLLFLKLTRIRFYVLSLQLYMKLKRRG